jgi:hypothetical protein
MRAENAESLGGAMRVSALSCSAIAVLMALTAPAEAAWHGYISHTFGFAFAMPAAPNELKIDKTSYKGAVAGTRDAMVWSTVQDNIEYQAFVIDTTAQASQSATLLGEAEYIFQDGKKLLMDSFGRVDRHYGRKLTIDLPNNGGRRIGCFYFINGRIISLQATVLPANGDYDNPEIARFIDSITFFPERAADDDTELPLPK